MPRPQVLKAQPDTEREAAVSTSTTGVVPPKPTEESSSKSSSTQQGSSPIYIYAPATGGVSVLAFVVTIFAALLAAYVGQVLAHKYALSRQQQDRRDARNDRRADDARVALGEVLAVVAEAKKTLDETVPRAWARRRFLRTSLSTDISDVDQHARDGAAYQLDMAIPRETHRSIADRRPRLALYFRDSDPVLMTFDSLLTTWEESGHAMVAVDEAAPINTLTARIEEYQTKIQSSVEKFGEAARSFVLEHTLAPVPDAASSLGPL